MKILRYAGAELMTGDAVASAVLEYCAALASEGAAEIIDIPIINDDGTRGNAAILVGPASQVVAQDVATDHPELVDPQAVALLESRTLAHRPVAKQSMTQPASSDDAGHWPDEL